MLAIRIGIAATGPLMLAVAVAMGANPTILNLGTIAGIAGVMSIHGELVAAYNRWEARRSREIEFREYEAAERDLDGGA